MDAAVSRLGGLLLLTVLSYGSAAAASPASERDRAQQIIDELAGRLGLRVRITATVVRSNALVVSVEPATDQTAFVMSFQGGFLADLSGDELRAVIAHELGHVWIYTHHPYLQTERLANDVALRVVPRDSLVRVYDKVWAMGGVKGDLARFLPAPD